MIFLLARDIIAGKKQRVKMSSFGVTGEAAHVIRRQRAMAMISTAAKGYGYSRAEEGTRVGGGWWRGIKINIESARHSDNKYNKKSGMDVADIVLLNGVVCLNSRAYLGAL